MFLRENRAKHARAKRVYFHERVKVREVPRWDVPKHEIWIKGRDILASRAEYVRIRRARHNTPEETEPYLGDETGWCSVRHGSDPALRARNEHMDLIPYYYGHVTTTTTVQESPPKKPRRRESTGDNTSELHAQEKTVGTTAPVAPKRSPCLPLAGACSFNLLQEKPVICTTCQLVECRCRRRPFSKANPAIWQRGWTCPTCQVRILESEKCCPSCNMENLINSPPLKNPSLPVPTYRWV